MSRKIPFWLAITITAGLTAYAFVITGSKAQQPGDELVQDPASIVARPSPDRLRAGALWPQLRSYLKELGDRLEQSGKERLTLGGTLNHAGEQSVAFTAILEFPDRLQLIAQAGDQVRTLTFDGHVPRVIGGTVSSADQDLIESLVNDTAEHFFKTQEQGAPTRHLGDRFRADDGSTESYAGSHHDVFLLQDRVAIASVPRSQAKLYYFNSETRLLERVTYQISRNGQTVNVETQFSDWQRIQDQQVAQRVVRLENGQQGLSLTITSATVGPRLSDGLF